MTELTLEKIGPYRLLNEIGRGGMGIVYEARDETSGRIVAIKVLPGTFGLGPHNLERFRREAQAAARIDHPAVVPVYDVGSLGGMHYVVMKRLPGPNLQEAPRPEWRDREIHCDHEQQDARRTHELGLHSSLRGSMGFTCGPASHIVTAG